MAKALTGAPLVAIALLALGCAGGGGGQGKVYGANFPSAQEVARLEARPRPQAVFDADLRQAEAWVLEAEAPERIEARRWTAKGALGERLSARVDATGGAAVPTRAMHCVAEELARFALESGGRPDFAVQRFIGAACNADVSNFAYRWFEGEIGANESHAELLERWGDDLAEMVAKLVEPGVRSRVGIGFARLEDTAAVFAVSGRALVELEPVATRLEPGQAFELRGRALTPAESIQASINRGRFGVAECDRVGEVRLPAFHFACRPDPTDHSARVTLSLFPPNRFLGDRALDAIVWPRGGGRRAYERVRYTTPRAVNDSALFAQTFVEELNQVRARARMEPLRLEAAQSATATGVAPHYFAALVGSEHERVADAVALGLMAGWDVKGDIRDAGFTSGVVPESDDLAELMGSMLEDPVGRFTLLDPETDLLAVGPVRDQTEGVPVLGAVITSYTLFEEGTEQADADALFAHLTRARHARERPPPYRLVDVWLAARDSAGEVRRGERLKNALDSLLRDTVDKLSREVVGWYGVTSDLAEFEFPDDMVNAARLGTAIGVSRYKDPDEAWARYVVLMVSVVH